MVSNSIAKHHSATSLENQVAIKEGDDQSPDLSGDDASGRFVAKIAQFPGPGQDLVAAKVQFAQTFGVLVHQPFPHGGAVLDHVGADAGLGFGVGGGSVPLSLLCLKHRSALQAGCGKPDGAL
jgi:hypothetical protein